MFLSAIKLTEHKFLFEMPLPFTNPINGEKLLQVPLFGTMMMLGFIVGFLLVRRLCRKDNLNVELVANVLILSLVSGVIGSRLFYVIQHKMPLSEYHKLSEGGLVWYGGLFAAIVTSTIYVCLKGAPLLKIFDACAPGTAIGLAFGRIGCFFNGCCWGKMITPTPDGPWYGVVYSKGSPPHTFYFQKYAAKYGKVVERVGEDGRVFFEKVFTK